MSSVPSDAWFKVFPSPRIPDVLSYVASTWTWLRATYPSSVAFNHDEPALTDNLCEALADQDRRFSHQMDCDFQPELWELRRAADGTTTRVARTDIKVILGAPGTPHFVLEFKKLDGTGQSRWRYCHDGLNRFVEGKYAVGHHFGAMCSFTSTPAAEAIEMAKYIAKPKRAKKLQCLGDDGKAMITSPSGIDPLGASFDSRHNRPTLAPATEITVLHAFFPCDVPEEETDVEEGGAPPPGIAAV